MMAVLITDGRRRCDAHCYGARGHHCTCICGGRNHGRGFETALRNTQEMVEAQLRRDSQNDKATVTIMQLFNPDNPEDELEV